MNNYTKYETPFNTILFYEPTTNHSLVIPTGFTDEEYSKILKFHLHQGAFGVRIFTTGPRIVYYKFFGDDKQKRYRIYRDGEFFSNCVKIYDLLEEYEYDELLMLKKEFPKTYKKVYYGTEEYNIYGETTKEKLKALKIKFPERFKDFDIK